MTAHRYTVRVQGPGTLIHSPSVPREFVGMHASEIAERQRGDGLDLTIFRTHDPRCRSLACYRRRSGAWVHVSGTTINGIDSAPERSN